MVEEKKDHHGQLKMRAQPPLNIETVLRAFSIPHFKMCRATSLINGSRHNKSAVEGNSVGKPAGSIPKREMPIFSSATSPILHLCGVQETL
jgi:hypothetical protein